jgi:hypothetical protein
MARAMTPEEHVRIADAVQAAEANTSGEIYCVVARSSDSYFFPAAFMVTLGIVVISLAVAYLLDRWWYDLPPMNLVVAQLIAIACALMVLGLFPAIRIHLVPLRQRYRQSAGSTLVSRQLKNLGPRPLQAWRAGYPARTPLDLAACVAIASINGGERQSYGGNRSSLNLALTLDISDGGAPDSMIDDTNAANSGAAHPLSLLNSG